MDRIETLIVLSSRLITYRDKMKRVHGEMALDVLDALNERIYEHETELARLLTAEKSYA